MNKLTTKTIGKWKWLSLAVAIILVVGLVIGILFGVNGTTGDRQVLTVEMNRITFKDDKAEVETIVTDQLAEAGLVFEKRVESEIAGDFGRVLYYFDKAVDLSTVQADLKAEFVAQTANGGALEGANVSVSVHKEAITDVLAEGYVVRAVIASVVFAVLALVYVFIRYKSQMGVTMGIALVAGAGLTTALTVLTRIPVTGSFVYVLATSLLVTAVLTALTLNNLRSNLKTDAFQNLSASDAMAKSVAWKLGLTMLTALAVAFVLVGAFAFTTYAWFALDALLALVCSAFSALVFAPAVYVAIVSCKLAQKTSAKKVSDVEDKQEQA